MSELNQEIKKVLEKDPSLMTKLKGVILKFAENVVAPVAPIESIVAPVEAPIELAASTAKLKDGTNVSYEGELVAGALLNVVAEDGTMSVAPDGTHELEDGTIVVVANGLVESVTPKAVEVPEVEVEMTAPVAQAFSAIELKFAAEKKANEDLKAEITEMKEAFKTTLLAFKTIIEAPVVESTVVKKKSYDEMTNHEKMLFNKGKL